MMATAINADAKKADIMAFLHQNVFDPVLTSPKSSNRLKQGVRATIMRMNKLSPASMVQYYWSAIVGTEKSMNFADDMRKEGFSRFEDQGVIDDFRRRFDDDWLRSP
jgi:hypothetical protein